MATSLRRFVRQKARLIYSAVLGRYEFRCSFEDRGLAKDADLAWDPEGRCWHTDKHSRAVH